MERRVTVCCTECSNYFDIGALEPADLTNPICYDCEEKAAAPCAHDNVRVMRFDVGRCTDTGYHDDGELIVCTDCGFEEVA